MSILPSFKLAAIAAAVAFVAGCILAWRITSWHCEANETKAAHTAAAAEHLALQSVIDNLKTQIANNREASYEYQAELSALRAKRQPAPAVRLCKPTSSAPVDLHPASAGSGGTIDTPASTGNIPPADGQGRDIGPELYGIADDADAVSAQLRALQDWIRRGARLPDPGV